MMHLKRFVLLVAAMAIGSAAYAQYPTKTVTIVVPCPFFDTMLHRGACSLDAIVAVIFICVDMALRQGKLLHMFFQCGGFRIHDHT